MSVFGDPSTWPLDDLVGWSAELSPELALAGYAEGVFPMPVADVIGWFSPLQRGVLPLDAPRVSRSLRKSVRRYRTTSDRAFEEVLAGCADPRRPGGWIDAGITETYRELHRRGYVHSVETWDDAGRLVGGLYGVHVGGFFAGESMFHDPELGRDASKVALLHLVGVLRSIGVSLVDVQWRTEHLATLGVLELARPDYLARLGESVGRTSDAWPSDLQPER